MVLGQKVYVLGKTLKRLIIDQKKVKTCFLETMMDQSVHRIFSLQKEGQVKIKGDVEKFKK